MTATQDSSSGNAGEDRRTRVMRELRVAPGSPAGLAGRDTAWTGGEEFAALSADELGATARELLERGVRDLRHAQERLSGLMGVASEIAGDKDLGMARHGEVGFDDDPADAIHGAELAANR